MGDPAQYPEIRAARFQYAMQWLPPDLRADYQLSASFDNNGSTTTCAQNHGARRARWSGLVFVATIAGASRALLRHRYVARSPFR